VSDVVSLARAARESLAHGLDALQGDPNVPAAMLDLAAPIAKAMGSLHQIERSGGAEAGSGAQAALTQIQSALAHLQAEPPQNRAVAVALEAVAASLGTVHALARAAAQGGLAPRTPIAPAPQPASVSHAPAAAQAPSAAHAAAAPHAPSAAHAASVPQGLAFQPTIVAPLRPASSPAPAKGGSGKPGRVSSKPPKGDGSAITAELGAHSPSNFYKGLSGNDIIDHGGLFVSTYKLPKIGQPVRLRVSLPGGYEFEANAIVRWRREASDAGNDAPPGFGAQFTEITAEARQLVYRYVRNREPLFHDDL
jgi:hypothetical protein